MIDGGADEGETNAAEALVIRFGLAGTGVLVSLDIKPPSSQPHPNVQADMNSSKE